MSRYKIIRSIFRGRNTEIFHGIIVHPQGLGSQVAIKRLHEEIAQDEPAVRAFLNEARVGGSCARAGAGSPTPTSWAPMSSIDATTALALLRAVSAVRVVLTRQRLAR